MTNIEVRVLKPDLHETVESDTRDDIDIVVEGVV